MFRHLAVKFDFQASWTHSPPPLTPETMLIFLFLQFDCTDHSTYTTLNWGTGGIRELTLEANKIEQISKKSIFSILKVSQLLLSLFVWRLFMQIASISFVYPSFSKFIFTKATKCAFRVVLDSRKCDNFFFIFLAEIPRQRRNLVYSLNKWIHI